MFLFSAQEKAAAAQNTPTARDVAILSGETGTGLTCRTRNATTAFNRVIHAKDQVVRLERQLGIAARWTANSTDYMCVAEFVKHRKSLRAVDDLEHLVVQ